MFSVLLLPTVHGDGRPQLYSSGSGNLAMPKMALMNDRSDGSIEHKEPFLQMEVPLPLANLRFVDLTQSVR